MNWNEYATLFLDRDGVINRHIEGRYITRWEDFEFIEGSLEALKALSKFFKYIIVVTNQSGIERGYLTETDLHKIHGRMLQQINTNGGRIDSIFYSTGLSGSDTMRKPNTGMAIEAQKKYKDIDFKHSIMVGDKPSDIEFGKRLSMQTVFLSKMYETDSEFTLHCNDLYQFSKLVKI
ncbi:MAG: HAD family hydrolase [Bacteroides oleiciplenus]|nr:HAD family hydrolase [Bacteroides oleiciplenus]